MIHSCYICAKCCSSMVRVVDIIERLRPRRVGFPCPFEVSIRNIMPVCQAQWPRSRSIRSPKGDTRRLGFAAAGAGLPTERPREVSTSGAGAGAAGLTARGGVGPGCCVDNPFGGEGGLGYDMRSRVSQLEKTRQRMACAPADNSLDCQTRPR